jgi:hypothetical protein
MIHPGADEVGSALVARLICENAADGVPRSRPIYAVPGGEEDHRALRGPRCSPSQSRGRSGPGGGELTFNTPDEADIILGVLTPSPRRTEFRDDFAAAERADREGTTERSSRRLRTTRRRVARSQSGMSRTRMGRTRWRLNCCSILHHRWTPPPLPRSARGTRRATRWASSWAQAVCSLFYRRRTPPAQGADCFPGAPFPGGWGYQTVVRRDARAAAQAQFGTRDPDPENPSQVAAVAAVTEAGLAGALALLQERGIGAGLRLAAGSVRFPWRRTFEVDFDLV